jgi:hypothetical protein
VVDRANLVAKFMSALAVPLLLSLPFSAIFGSLYLNRRWPALCGQPRSR